MTGWGVHLLDYALMGMKVANPNIVTVGGKFAKPDSADEAPDTLMALYEFDGFNIIGIMRWVLVMVIMEKIMALLLLVITEHWY